LIDNTFNCCSKTFEAVEQENVKTWRFYRISVIMEYDSKSLRRDGTRSWSMTASHRVMMEHVHGVWQQVIASWCNMFVEYDNKPSLAPPLIIFGHIWKLGYWMYDRCSKENESKRS